MDDDTRAVAESYNRDTEYEWQRLVKSPYHTLEFQVVMHHLRKHLPPRGRILDAGGGPGRYAIELCQAGYEVVLLDLSPGNIALAREKFDLQPQAVQDKLLEAVVGDMRDLSRFDAGSFDAVLCLGGPLTHISDTDGRSRAVSELVRVTRPGAAVCIVVVGYLAVLRTILLEFSHELLDPPFESLVQEGDATGPTKSIWHFFRADELRQLAESHGLETVEMAGCQGLSTGLIEATNALAQDEARWQVWIDLLLRTLTESAVVDMAEHILYIGRVPDLCP
ncbi:MAG: class I SAM-dependent methyltransferase [Anaerolineae bacterium]|nr:class I SAM-dependent methyltransferase [Anaerolineae bacterium]